jgi:hypothetical protein
VKICRRRRAIRILKIKLSKEKKRPLFSREIEKINREKN